MTIISTTVCRNPLEKWSSLHSQQKSPKCNTCMQSQKNNRMISVCFQGKPFSITVQFSSVAQSCPTLCDPTNRSMPGFPVHHQLPEFTQTHVHWVGDAIQPSHTLSSPNAGEAEVEWFLKTYRPCRTPKRCPFHYRGPECKSRKSRDTWSNRQIWPWSTKWSMAKPNRVLQRECTGHSKHPVATTQEKTLHMDTTRWSTLKSDWTRPGDDCGSDHELIIAKFRLKFKKVGKTTRPFRYDLNQIPYNWLYSGSEK